MARRRPLGFDWVRVQEGTESRQLIGGLGRGGGGIWACLHDFTGLRSSSGVGGQAEAVSCDVSAGLRGMDQVLTKIATQVCVCVYLWKSWAQAGVKCVNWDIWERREPPIR